MSQPMSRSVTGWTMTPQPVEASQWQFPMASALPESAISSPSEAISAPGDDRQRLPPGHLPDGRERVAGRARLVVARPARHHAARWAARHAVDAAEREALRDPVRHLLFETSFERARIRRARTAGSPRPSSRPTRGCTRSDGRTASRCSIGAACLRAGCTAFGSPDSSPANRCFIGSATRRKSR